MRVYILLILLVVIGLVSCSKNTNSNEPTAPVVQDEILKTFGGAIDLNNLYRYSDDAIPAYIRKDNHPLRRINDKNALLGRVLFYDKQLSVNNTISCASCHRQEFAFSDTAVSSKGVNGNTGRHSMRLVNARFSDERNFFWDERAPSLEIQTSMPIKDHAEMGYSGENGDPSITDLMNKLKALGYYRELFTFVFGDADITETRLQTALSEFVRSIQSFDSKYDQGRSQAVNDGVPFSNFTMQENAGKNLFLTPPTFNGNSERTAGGLGCAGCHRPPEFDIVPNSGNNGITGSLNGTGPDFNVTRSPSLRDLVNPLAIPNGPMMHTAVIKDIKTAIGHYGNITAGPNNNRLDPKLKPNNLGQKLQLTADEVNAVTAFLNTLSGNKLYTAEQWSNPFP